MQGFLDTIKYLTEVGALNNYNSDTNKICNTLYICVSLYLLCIEIISIKNTMFKILTQNMRSQ